MASADLNDSKSFDEYNAFFDTASELTFDGIAFSVERSPTLSMTQKVSAALETLPAAGAVPLESILCTEALRCRPSRPLAEKVLQIVRADSVDLSPVTKDERRFCWAAIAGVGLRTRGRDVLR
jgi:hypothetical protein